MNTTLQTYGVKYIGSKAALLSHILAFVDKHLPAGSEKGIIDVFTGTTRVAQAFRASGWAVQTSDLSWASEAYAHAFVIRTAASGARIPALLENLRGLAVGDSGSWITANYCDVTGDGGSIVRMWKPANGKKADAIREQIAAWELAGEINRHETMILVACLIFALDKVDSSVGVQQAYLKNWAARASNALNLVDLPFAEGAGAEGAGAVVGLGGNHIIGDALKVTYAPATVAYLDPPYSAHSYATYYHIWDSITRWDKPTVGLKTNRRIDRVVGADGYDTEMGSAWNSKRTALAAFLALIARLPVAFVVVSYNDESLVPLEVLVSALKTAYPGDGRVVVEKIQYQRNIMSQIGNAAVGVAARGEVRTQNNEVLIWIQRCT